MRDQSAWNMYIFRDGRTTTDAAELLNDLTRALRAISLAPSPDKTMLLDTLLRAGELECALDDLHSPSATVMARITESLASVLVATEFRTENAPVLPVGDLLRSLETAPLPVTVEVSPPEGFAYYSLHPLGYVDLLRQAELKSTAGAVIGIRSIGTTLSAVVQAGLQSIKVPSERITVRPVGHPYDRSTEFTHQQKSWIGEQRSRGAHFFVVDEGPGMSGSSFLSVGDALMAAGVECEHITFLCSRVPDPSSLTATNAASRWPLFRALHVAPNHRLPAGADEFVAGGIWRERFFGDERNWPASWTQMERLKFLSRDGRYLSKFEGLGRFGGNVHGRALLVGKAGFGPSPIAVEEGFSIYPIVKGEKLLAGDLADDVITRIADYCVFRTREIPVQSASTATLEEMLRFNLREEFGVDTDHKLPIVRPVIADGRMLPHKFLRTANGELLKVDNASHGDDHFFPGPTDIAWDLAGAIVEWDMSEAAAESLLRNYQNGSGDDARSRLPAYLVAYSVFRMGYCKMAAESTRGSSEEARLAADYSRYRQIASKWNNRASLRPEISTLVPATD